MYDVQSFLTQFVCSSLAKSLITACEDDQKSLLGWLAIRLEDDAAVGPCDECDSSSRSLPALDRWMSAPAIQGL